MRILFGIFLIAHGLIHASFLSPEPPQKPGAPAWPFHLDKSWLSSVGFGSSGLKLFGIILVILTVLGFAILGLGWMGIPGINTFFVPITLFSSTVSILLLIIFWNNWFILGPLIDLALIYYIYFQKINF